MKVIGVFIKSEPTVTVLVLVALVFVVLVLLVELFYAPTAYGGGIAPVTPGIGGALPTIAVTASGSVSGVPSEGTLYLYVNGSGSSAAVATANLSATVAAMNSTLKSYINNNMSEIKTSSYSLQKTYNKSSYTAIESFQITIPQVANVSAAIGSLSAISNVYVSEVSAQLSPAQITQLRAAALTAALSNATTQAKVVAMNSTIRAQNITISSFSVYPYPVYSLSAAVASSGGGSGSAPGIYSGTQQVSETVSVIFVSTR